MKWKFIYDMLKEWSRKSFAQKCCLLKKAKRIERVMQGYWSSIARTRAQLHRMVLPNRYIPFGKTRVDPVSSFEDYKKISEGGRRFGTKGRGTQKYSDRTLAILFRNDPYGCRGVDRVDWRHPGGFAPPWSLELESRGARQNAVE